MKLRSRIFISILIVILVLGSAIALLGFVVIQREIVARSQDEVSRNLKSMRYIYNAKTDGIIEALSIISHNGINKILPSEIGADYIRVATQISDTPSSVVRNAFYEKKIISGSRLVAPAELELLGKAFAADSAIYIVETQRARPTEKKVEDRALVIECAIPRLDYLGNVTSVLYAGRIINNDVDLIDEIHNFIFEDTLYEGKLPGTATIFLDDVRITTNVLTEKGERAIGTRVSEEVYNKVIGSGEAYRSRAFVVTDWYVTAYEPISDPDGKRIGALYVGRLEKPFMDMTIRVLLIFGLILAGSAVAGSIISFFLASNISKPVFEMYKATKKISSGLYPKQVSTGSRIKEIHSLAEAFETMILDLSARESAITAKSEQLAALNKSYLDLIGFVSHELKGILASTILNAYTVRDGFLGMINFKQRKALDSITRNLDYLAETVKNFLNLSRIEKGELNISKAECLLREDIFDETLEAFGKAIADQEMVVINEIPVGEKIPADRDMLFIVANNIVGNAIKYGNEKGRIILSVSANGDMTDIEIYNDGQPLSKEDADKMFGKFVRLDLAKKRHVKGTGLGLYITKEIVERHGGTLACRPEEEGNSFIISLPRGKHEESA